MIVTTVNANSSIVIEQGSAAPYSGILLSKEESQKIKFDLVELDYQKEINKSLEKSIELYKKEVIRYQEIQDILLKQNDKLAISLKDAKELSGWEKTGYFILGIVTTTVIVYATAKSID